MPLSALDELLSYAHKEEARREKHDLEKELMPLWLVNYSIARLKGEGDIMDFETFIDQALEPGKKKGPPREMKTPEEIMKEFAPFIEAERKRGADG